MAKEDIKPADVHRAQKLAGSLIWLSTSTRPHISYTIESIEYGYEESCAGLGGRKQGSEVLQCTTDVGLHFRKSPNSNVVVYGDANYAAERSKTGLVIKVGDNTVALRSCKQAVVARSKTDSEVQAMAMTAILGEMVKALKESIMMPTENFGAHVRQQGHDHLSKRRRKIEDQVLDEHGLFDTRDGHKQGAGYFICEHQRAGSERIYEVLDTGASGGVTFAVKAV